MYLFKERRYQELNTFISAGKDWLEIKARQKEGNELLQKANKQQNTGNQSAKTSKTSQLLNRSSTSEKGWKS